MHKSDKPTSPPNPAPLKRGYRPTGGKFGYKPINLKGGYKLAANKKGITKPPSNPPNQGSSGKKG